MSKNVSKSVAAAFGTGLAVSMAAPVVAADNPFQMIEFGDGVEIALEARDMKGNKVVIDEETGFEYGGDNKGKYAGGKIGTGKKDPAVCGTFTDDSCSVDYVEKK